MTNEIKNIKKIELHIHLDGSVQIGTIKKLTNEKEEVIKSKMMVDFDCRDLTKYLEKFNYPIEFLQTKENLKIISKGVADYLESQNVIYAEIRFAPMKHTEKGLNYDEIIESVIEGLNENKNVKTKLILCMMRGAKYEDNEQTLLACYKYLKKGVCALDLAGDENNYPIDEYLPLFKKANELKIPFTIHAGEQGNTSEIYKAINIGARRIGHGIASLKDNDLLKIIKEKNIILEICPRSNIQTNPTIKYETHPIKELYNLGVKTTINTDNPTISNITLNEEYENLLKVGFSINDLKIMNSYSLESAFLNENEKEELKNLLNNVN